MNIQGSTRKMTPYVDRTQRWWRQWRDAQDGPPQPVCKLCGEPLGQSHLGTCDHSLMRGGPGIVTTEHTA